jgi:endo-1,4-beta-xylanase
MRSITARAFTALAAFALLSNATLAGGNELLRNGSFTETAEGGTLPASWESPDPTGITWLRNESPPALQLEAGTANPAPTIQQEIALPAPLPAALRVEAGVKMEDIRRGEKTWHSGRILVTYLDAQGNILGETFTLDRLQGDSPWKTVRRQFPMVAGAAKVRLELQLLNAASGRISFRDVSLRALDSEEAQAWRKEADERIRRHRMADLHIRVEDAAGKPLPDADVAIFQRQHSYPFGTAVKTKFLLEPAGDPHTDTYVSVFRNFFNYATLENELKAPRVERDGLAEPLLALDWLRRHGIAARGHVLTWPSYEMSAKAVVAAKDDPAKVRALMKEHFHNVLMATAPANIVDWDVVNEPAVHTDLIRLLGDDQVAEWFRWAHEDAPNSRLYLNENNVEFQGGNRDNLEKWLRLLQKSGAPIEGIGWQGHMWHRTLPSGQNILDDLDHFTPYGLPIQITEYDTDERFSDEDDARFMDEFLTAWFSHPLTAGFIMWGFQDAHIWNRNAPLFTSDWTLKPSGKAWMDLVYGKWWTEVSGRTNADGTFATRAFLGTYEVEARHGGKRAILKIDLPRDGRDIIIRFDSSTEKDTAPALSSSNPYRSGKLPARLAPKKEELISRAVRLSDGSGAWAASGPKAAAGQGLQLIGSERAADRQDLFLRFDPGQLSGKSVVDAAIVLQVARPSTTPARLHFYALSGRFIPQSDEAGLDWKPEDIRPGRAPGRDPQTGEYRLGDASVIYLGETTIEKSETGTQIRFSSPNVARAVQAAAGKGITIIVAASNSRIDFFGPTESLKQPSLELKTRK